jgi:hypothetical protein
MPGSDAPASAGATELEAWLAWMSYIFLATIHALSRIRERQQAVES